MAIKIPGTRAPDLTRASQNINIPPGASGENVFAAVANLGGVTADAANKLNIANFRLEERRSSTRADTAFKGVSIAQHSANDVAKQEAIKDPTLLPGFQPDQTKRYDLEMSKITQGMDKRTKQKFDALSEPLRTSLANANILWSRGQEVANGRNEMNAVVQGMIATASQVPDTEDLKNQIAIRLDKGQAEGHLLDGRFRPKDLNIEINKSRRQVDINKAHSMVDQLPQLLKNMLDDPDQLQDLTDADRTEFRNRANSSISNIKQKAEHQAWAYNIDTFGTQGLAAFRGIANYGELAAMIDDTTEQLEADPDNLILRSRVKVLTDALSIVNKPQDVVIEEKAQKKVIEGKATELADERLGKVESPSEEDQFANQVAFVGRYNELVEAKSRRRGNRRGPTTTTVAKDASVQLQELANLQGDLIRAVAQKNITKGFAIKYFEKLMNPMRNLIESKHFQAQAGFWGMGKKGADKYSGPFTHVLGELEKAASAGATFMNDPIAQNLAITFVFEEAERQDLSDDGIKNDSIKTEQAIKDISKAALNRTKRFLLNLDSQDEIPDAVMTTAPPAFPPAPQAVIDIVLAKPDDPAVQSVFISRYGQDQFDAIRGQ
jgi:hypothetical protein|tara:strand:+ start:1315 stop:3132 length:1818 start_codon:yes stop_codon:yes gene_type:complete